MRNPIYFLLLSFFIVSCNFSKKDKTIPEAENMQVDLKIKRLEGEFFNAKSPEEMQTVFQKYPQVSYQYFEVKPFQEKDDQFFKHSYEHFSNKHLSEFYLYTVNDFGDFSVVSKPIERMFKYIKYYYPQYRIPEINTLVTGFRFERDISFSDSLIVISIDYFNGEDSPYRPGFYEYMLTRYKKPYLAPMLGLGISAKFNNSDPKDETLLSHMIYYGKAHYFLESVMPGIPDSLNIMYSSQELKDIQDNSDIIWSHFVTNKLLFDQSPRIRDKYLGEAPKVNELGEKCPGRIGRWLGWQIVKKYMENHPDVTLQELMAETDAQKIFKLSKFKPK